MTKRQARAEVAILLMHECRQALFNGYHQTCSAVETPEDAQRMEQALKDFAAEMKRRSMPVREKAE